MTTIAMDWVFAFHLGYPEVPWFGNALLALWLWCFGANVGSFMNVVIFRVPAGRSVVRPRSQCPGCHQLIRWYDNIPVFSWLLLRARCRHCGMTISARYPIVELWVGLTFVVLAFLSPIRTGENFPANLWGHPLRLHTMFSVWLMYAYHLLAWCTLVCAAMMLYDGRRPPLRVFYPAAIIGVLAPVVMPLMRPIPFHAPLDWEPHLVGLLDGIAGAAVGGMLGIFATAWETPSRARRTEVAGSALTGLILGWQAAAALIPAALCLAAFLGSFHERARRFGLLGFLSLLIPCYIAAWRVIVETIPSLGPRAGIETLALSVMLTTAFHIGRLVPWTERV